MFGPIKIASRRAQNGVFFFQERSLQPRKEGNSLGCNEFLVQVTVVTVEQYRDNILLQPGEARGIKSPEQSCARVVYTNGSRSQRVVASARE